MVINTINGSSNGWHFDAKDDKVQPSGQEEERCIYKLAFPLI